MLLGRVGLLQLCGFIVRCYNLHERFIDAVNFFWVKQQETLTTLMLFFIILFVEDFGATVC